MTASRNPVLYPFTHLRRDYQGQELCSVARTLEIVGDRWTWLIVRDAFLGMTKFAEFQSSLGIAPNVLGERLNRLTAEGSSSARSIASARPGTSIG